MKVTKVIRERLHDKINIGKVASFVIVFCVLEVLMLAYIVTYGDIYYTSSVILLLVAGVLGGIVAIQAAWALLRAFIQAQSAQRAVRDLENLNRAMSAQRHDFKNHIQVVYALIDMGEYQEAQKYLRRVNSDLENVSRAQRTAQPAINALLQAKLALCGGKGIAFDLEVTSRLESLPVESWQVCRVLGNLIDNAIDAVEDSDSPRVRVSIFPFGGGSCMRVENNGPQIPENAINRIFTPGFSTKGDGRGMGLPIVKDILDGCGGRISLESDSNATVFHVELPPGKAPRGALNEPDR